MDTLEAYELTGNSHKWYANTRGGEYRGACFKCGGDKKSDRFIIWNNYKGGRYWCRTCGIHGDTIQLLVEGVGFSYRDAFKAVGRENESFSSGRSWVRKTKAIPNVERLFEPPEIKPPPDLWQEKAEQFVQEAHKTLLGMPSVLKYLASRGLDEVAVKKFKLGYFPGENGNGSMYRPRESWGLPKQINEKTGREKVLWLPRGIVIPHWINGKVGRLRIRRPKPDLTSEKAVKYYIVPGSCMVPMSINPDQKAIMVVESELDGLLMARHAGSITGVVALGSAAAKPGADVFPYLKKALRILVALDFDEAGLKAWGWWNKTFPSARQWPVPFEKDPGDAFKEGLNLKEWVKAGLPPALTMVPSSTHDISASLKPPEGLLPYDELRFFLKRLPIKITATQTKNEVDFNGVGNSWIQNRVKQLFFEDEDLFYYLKMYHPDDVISGENYDWSYNMKGESL